MASDAVMMPYPALVADGRPESLSFEQVDDGDNCRDLSPIPSRTSLEQPDPAGIDVAAADYNHSTISPDLSALSSAALSQLGTSDFDLHPPLPICPDNKAPEPVSNHISPSTTVQKTVSRRQTESQATRTLIEVQTAHNKPPDSRSDLGQADDHQGEIESQAKHPADGDRNVAEKETHVTETGQHSESAALIVTEGHTVLDLEQIDGDTHSHRENDVEFPVDKILKHRLTDGHVELLVRWGGDWVADEPTWEPEEDLWDTCRDKVLEYWCPNGRSNRSRLLSLHPIDGPYIVSKILGERRIRKAGKPGAKDNRGRKRIETVYLADFVGYAKPEWTTADCLPSAAVDEWKKAVASRTGKTD